MKFIRDIISEKRALALGRGAESPRASAPESPPLPQDVISAPRAPITSPGPRPTYQLPLTSLVDDDADILNVLNPMDDDEAEGSASAIAADDFEFGYDIPPRHGKPAIDSPADEENESELPVGQPELDMLSEPEDDEGAENSEVEADLTLRAGIGAVMAAARTEMSDTPERDFERAALRAEVFEDDDDMANDDLDLADPDEDDFDDLSVAADDVEPLEAPSVSRKGLFSAIAAAEMATPEDDDPAMAAGLWTGAVPQARSDRDVNPREAIRDPSPPRAVMPPAVPYRPAMPQAPRPPMPAQAVSAPAQTGRSASEDAVDVPAPAFGRGNRRAGRVKTRLLGFNGGQTQVDPFAAAALAQSDANEQDSTAPAPVMFPVGWLVVVAGPGTGASFPLPAGVAQIGRGVGQAIRLDLGDTSISRENHAAIAYDSEQRKYFLGHGGKANLVRLNNRPVLSTEEIFTGNTIRIGETTLRFVALCGEAFDWSQV